MPLKLLVALGRFVARCAFLMLYAWISMAFLWLLAFSARFFIDFQPFKNLSQPQLPVRG